MTSPAPNPARSRHHGYGGTLEPRLGRQKRGFSVVELMNLLALAAVLSALGMYAMARYVRHTKTAEAVDSITRIAGAAAGYYDTADANQPAGTKPEAAHAMRHFPPSAKDSVPNDSLSVRGKRFQSSKNEWAVSPWRELQFSMTQPQCYAYSFESEGSGALAKATVTAHGDLDADGVTSTYRLTVAADPTLSAKVSTVMERLDPEE